jgi:uncharacterized phiE125 gp8 family phage protein
MVLKLVTGPAVEPLTTDEAKLHLKVTGSTEDAYIDSLVKAARTNVERYLSRALITQTWRAYSDYWQDCLNLALAPVISVTSVKYYDETESLTPLDSSLYYADIISEPGKIVRKYDSVYPELEEERPNAVVVEFVAGYGSASTDIPSDIIHAIRLLVADYYDNKGEVVVGTIAVRIPGHIKNLLHSYRLYDFAN